MPTQYHFVMRSGPTVGKIYPLDAPEITIGRDAGNTITINDGEVSRKHARMELRGSTYLIQDLGSTNGTFVNGARISAMQVLNAGDTVAFGQGIVLVYEPVADQNATILSSKPPQPSSQVTAQSPMPIPTPKPSPAPSPAPRPAPVSAPVSKPASAPAPVSRPAPVPPPVYSGQVPAGPVPVPPEPAPEKKKFPVWLIVVIVLLVLICGCIGIFVVIDQLSLWCKVVPFLVPLLGGTCS